MCYFEEIKKNNKKESIIETEMVCWVLFYCLYNHTFLEYYFCDLIFELPYQRSR